MMRTLHGAFGFLNKPQLKVPRNLYLPRDLRERVYFSDHLHVMQNNRASIHGGGIAFSEREAGLAALGEYMERYASSFQLKHQLCYGSYEELKHTRPCYPPHRIRYFTETQYRDPNFKLHRLQETSPTHWIKACNYITQEEIWLPFFMVNVENIKGDGLYHKNTSTGTASHTKVEQAIQGGLLECIERDAFAAFWYFQHRLQYKKYAQAFILEKFKSDQQIQQLFATNRVKITTYDLSEYAFCPTFVVFILFKKGDTVFQSVGSATRLNKKEALVKAAIEAYQGIEYTAFACEQYKEVLTQEKIEAFDFSEIDSFKKHYALYNLYPALVQQVPILQDVRSETNYATTWEAYHPHHLVNLTAPELIKKGIDEVYYARLSTIDTLQLGFEVVKIVTPQLSFLTGDFNYPYLGGFDSHEDLFTSFPHPFP